MISRKANSYQFHAEGQVSYGELSLLHALREAGKPIALEPLTQLLMLQTRTVRQMMLDLEEKGYIFKQNDPSDARFMLSTLSEKGKTVAEKNILDCYLLMKESFWEALPESDFEEYLKLSMRKCVNHIRGFSVEPFGELPHTDLPIAVDHFIFWRVVVDRWMEAIRTKCELSLNDFCVLRCLFEKGSSNPSDIASDLLLPRSVLSLCKRHLIERQLITEKPAEKDGREISLSCTEQGKVTAEEGFLLLDASTCDAHFDISDEDTDLINAWYARMFRNMWKDRKKA